ncbi:MAG TPA: glycosyltransferase family 4 protein [Devosia sp.]|jgi:glycosyltransferase involved in cell wall biosynthesis|uniref:glycosyltransferase family 4 protein n=1 Tax=Devosia sp. TaxID=1871048 RepID=UPI002DDD872D|nr:glycosyltransferase family 4 protein [Devosia sp.]HEV2516879.1 glycosyltransferase family 4 protein [Devosia sp.]
MSSASRPLRILQILRAPVGGLFRHVYDLTHELAARGHEIGIVADSLHTDALTEERLGRLRPLAPLGIHSLPIPRTFGTADLTTPLQVRRLADALQIDVLHGHGAKGGLNARLARIGARQRVSLYTPHGGVLNYQPGSAAGRLFRLIERALIGATDAIVFESGFAQAAYIEQIGRPSCPGPVIHNGLMPAEFEPILPGPEAADFVFIGEFRAVKGISYLLEALVGARTPGGRPASLVMAGGGPDLEAIKAQITQLGLDDRVTLVGVKPARPTLHLGRIAVVPSLAESLPYVILEAAAAGRPVIATDVGGVREIYGPTAASLLPAADAGALRRAMQAALDNPVAAAREANLRLAHIRAGFSISHMTDQIEALYRQALAARVPNGFATSSALSS